MPEDYFTTIEEYFQAARGSFNFRFSVADWRFLEELQKSNVTQVAVLRGIDAAFRKHKASRKRFEQVNSLAYCKPQIMEEWGKLNGSRETRTR